ncbi:MAG: hypothetical protein ACRDSH_18410 [Pseudonocardiaceae bacterium]
MKKAVDWDEFRALLADQAIVFTQLPAGRERDLAARANEESGRGDGSLHTAAELDVLFAQLLAGGRSSTMISGPPRRPTGSECFSQRRASRWPTPATARWMCPKAPGGRTSPQEDRCPDGRDP